MSSNFYILDNSALSKMLHDDVLLEGFVDKNINFVITKETYVEAHSGQISPTFGRMTKLRDFNSKSKAGRFYFSTSLFRVLKKENRKAGRLVRIPIMPPEVETEHFKIFSDEQRYKHFKENSLLKQVEFVAEAKKRVLASDKKDSKNLAKLEKSIRHIVENYVGAKRLGELPSPFIGVFNEVISTTKMRRALRRTAKFPYLRAYCSALVLRMLGNELKSFRPDDELSFLQKKKLGNWYDLYFLAWSCPEHNLLSEDKDLIAFHKFFKSRNLTKTEAYTTEELLKSLI